MLEAVNLNDRLHSRVGSLSGGMRRRLGLAQALLGNPPIIIVDEPTTGLDPTEQQRFRTLLSHLAVQGNHTILLSTHIISDVATIANQLAVLEVGSIIFQGSVHALTRLAADHTWQWYTSIAQVEALQEQQGIHISSLQPASDKSSSPDQVLVRVIGKQPAPEATLVQPTLEDGYFSLIGTNKPLPQKGQ